MSTDDKKKRKAAEMGTEDDDASLVLENRRLADENKQLKEENKQLKVKLTEYEDDSSDDDDGDDESVCDGSPWSKNYFLLKQYKQEHGDCKVPMKHPQLGIWLKNIKAAFAKNKLSQEKVDRLNKLGIIWGKNYPAPPTWEERFQELKKYRDKFGHCNIKIDEKPELRTEMAKWIVEQRKQGKRLRKMKPSAMSMDQYDQLEALSFQWKTPKPKSKRS